jgi:hypothetical protein
VCVAALLAKVGKSQQSSFSGNGRTFFNLLQINEAVTSAELEFVPAIR